MNGETVCAALPTNQQLISATCCRYQSHSFASRLREWLSNEKQRAAKRSEERSVRGPQAECVGPRSWSNVAECEKSMSGKRNAQEKESVRVAAHSTLFERTRLLQMRSINN